MLVFRSWAGGLFGELGRVELLAPVLLGMGADAAVVEAVARAHFRYGPLEWSWRCLTYWQGFRSGDVPLIARSKAMKQSCRLILRYDGKNYLATAIHSH